MKSRKTLMPRKRAAAIGAFIVLAAGVPLALKRWGSSLKEASVPKAAPVAATEGGGALEKSRETRRRFEAAKAMAAAENEKVIAQRKAFEDDGWKFVDEQEPDEAVLGLDPQALNGREAELQTQLQTNTYSGEMLGKVRALLREATDAKTRFVAIESLGRAEDSSALGLLAEIFDESPRDRQQILGYLRPREPGDQTVEFLAGLLGRPDVEESLKRQAMGQLVGVSLMRGLQESLLNRLPSERREQFRALYRAALQGGAG